MITHEDFVVAYMTSKSTDEVAEPLGMKKPTVCSRANYLRKHGVKLPKFDKRKKLDTLKVAQLNSLVKKYKKMKLTGSGD